MKNKKGFTLIELLVVVLIIGILAAIAIPQYRKVVWKSKFQQLEIINRELIMAQEMYRLQHGYFSENICELDVDIAGVSCYNNVYLLFNGAGMDLMRGMISTANSDYAYISATEKNDRISIRTWIGDKRKGKECLASKEDKFFNELCLSMGYRLSSETAYQNVYSLP